MDRCPHCGADLPAIRDAFCPECRQGLDEPPLKRRTATTVESEPSSVSLRKYSVGHVCPTCQSSEYKPVRPDRWIAFTWDRVCRSCGTRYAPPTPTWAAVVFLVIGFLLAGLGFLGLIIRLLSGNVLAIPAMACEGFLAFLGILAIVQGLRALIKPGKA